MSVKKKRGLGRGLDTLLASKPAPAAEQIQPAPVNTITSTEDQLSAPSGSAPVDGQLRQLPVDMIQRGKYQPRRDMDPESLEELASSIRAQGVMQPIVVRPIARDRYEIIAGERRWRASQLAGLHDIPVIIRDVADDAAIAMALIENIQREDLNPMEEAMALQRLQEEFALTQQEVADAVGKSRSTVANLLRLLSLREDVRTLLEHGDLEMGHARALLGLPVHLQSNAANTVVAKSLSVRQTEALVRQLQEQKPSPASVEISSDIKQLETELSEKLGCEVSVHHSAKGKGKLVLKYNNLDELDGIIAHIR